MRVMWILPAVLLLALSQTAAAKPAKAPRCPGGKVAPANKKDACCWPGQSWSDASTACSGAPSKCPKGMEAHGETCEAKLVIKTRVDPKSKLQFVQLPAGTFHYGCERGDGCTDNEMPGEQVTLKSFWIGKTEVTAAAYQRCVEQKGCVEPFRGTPDLCNYARHGDYPMNCITWGAAERFCRWIGGRLPTAQQWEYAAKSGESRYYPWGNTPATGEQANFCDSNCKSADNDATQNDHYENSAPVGSYPKGATKYGLLDMAGNVWEWTDTDGGQQGQKQVRGGAWNTNSWTLRTSLRTFGNVMDPRLEFGFRCVQ